MAGYIHRANMQFEIFRQMIRDLGATDSVACRAVHIITWAMDQLNDDCHLASGPWFELMTLKMVEDKPATIFALYAIATSYQRLNPEASLAISNMVIEAHESAATNDNNQSGATNDTNQSAATNDNNQSGATNDTKQSGATNDTIQSGATSDTNQSGATSDTNQSGATNDTIQSGATNNIKQSGANSIADGSNGDNNISSTLTHEDQ
jgi:Ca2+-binding RTX toxin-like protein